MASTRKKKQYGKNGPTGMTERQAKFVDEYMVDRNPREAARRAGYTGTMLTTGNASMRLMNHPVVGAEIRRREEEAARRTDVTVDSILRELKRVAFFDIRSLFKGGKLVKDPNELSEDEARALINFDIVTLNKEGDYIVKLNPGNKMKALELLGKHLRMFVDKVEVEGGVAVNYNVDYGTGDPPASA